MPIKLTLDADGNLQYADEVEAPKPKPPARKKQPPYAGQTFDLKGEKKFDLDELAKSHPELVNKKYLEPLPKRSAEQIKADRDRKLKAEADVEAAKKKFNRFRQLYGKYQNRIPQNETERQENFELINMAADYGYIPTKELDRDKASKQFMDQIEAANRELAQRAKAAIRTDLSDADRFLLKVGQGIDELATGAYAIPATVFKASQRDQKLADEFLGGYGKSVKDLVAENQQRRAELEVPENASTFSKGVGIAGDVAGQLIPTIALASTGIGVPIAATTQGITSALAQGQEEQAALQGAFGGLGAFAGMAAEGKAIEFATKLFKGNNLLSKLGQQLTGRSVTAGAGAIINDFQNQVQKSPQDEARVNLITGAILDGLFYGGAKKPQGKATGLSATYERALDQATFPELIPTPETRPEVYSGLPSFEDVVKYFEPTKTRTALQGGEIKEPVKWYYSQLEKVVREKFPKKLTPEQATVMLRDPKYGIKADEFGYSGLDKLIAAKAAAGETISRDEILDTLNGNRLELKETLLGQKGAPLEWRMAEKDPKNPDLVTQIASDKDFTGKISERSFRPLLFDYRIVEDEYPNGDPAWLVIDKRTNAIVSGPFSRSLEARDARDAYVATLPDRKVYDASYRDNSGGRGAEDSFRTLDEAKDFIEKNRPVTRTEYSGFKALENGEPDSYRELLLQLPAKDPAKDEAIESRKAALNAKMDEIDEIMTRRYGDNWENPDNADPLRQEFLQLGIELSGLRQPIGYTGDYTAPHFANHKNILVHTRFDEGRGPNGERQLRIQEIQSDWHQNGREKGYNSAGIPDAPFKNTWHELAMKRMIRWAAENGYDEIIWTAGKQQIDLYQGELRRNVDTIVYEKSVNGLYENIYAYKDGQKVLTKTIKNPEELPALVGPAIATKLRETGRVEGDDLSIGGQVHKLLYDQKLPQFALKLAKKFNAIYGMIEGGAANKDVDPIRDGGAGFIVYGSDGRFVTETTTYDDAIDAYIKNELPDVTIERESFDSWRAVDNNGEIYQTQSYGPATGASRGAVLNSLFGDILERNPPKQLPYMVHRLIISPELRNSVLETGQSAFQKERNPLTMPRTQKEVEMHQQWGVPKWDPVTEGGSYIDHIDDARWTAVQTPQGPTLYTNAVGLGIFGALLDIQEAAYRSDILNTGYREYASVRAGVTGFKNFVFGSATPIEDLRHFSAEMRQLNDPEYQHVVDGFLNELDKAIKMAEDSGHDALVMLSLDRPTKDDIISTLRHEEVHRTQFNLEAKLLKDTNISWNMFDLDWFKTIPGYDKVVQGLKMLGSYDITDSTSIAREAIAYIGAGQYELLGLSAEQAADSFSTMLRYIADNYGIEQVRKFAFDPGWKGIINDVTRGAEEFRQQVESRTGSTGDSRSLYDRVVEWWNRDRSKDGERGVPTGVRTAFAKQPWENVDTNFKAPTYRERLGKFFEDKGLGPLGWTWVDKLHTELLDDMWPVLKTWSYLVERSGQAIMPSKNALYLFRNWLGGSRKVDTILSQGMIDAQGNFVTPGGFNWLIEPFRGLSKDQREGDMQAAIHLMVGQRTLELATKKAAQPSSGVSIKAPLTGIAGTDMPGNPFKNDITVAISKLKEIYNSGDQDRITRIEEAAKRYRQWADSLLNYYEQKGRITATKARELRNSNQQYVDLHRMFEDHEDAILDGTPKKIGNVKKLFREMKGSGAEIGNPYLNLLIATDQVVREADRNEALNAFVSPLRDMLLDPNLSNADRKVLELIGKRHNDATKDTTKVWNNGHIDNWELHPEIQAALENWRSIPHTLVLEALTLPLRILRGAITHSPGFLVRNFLRDSQARTITSRTFNSAVEAANPLNGSTLWDGLPELFKSPSNRDRQALWLHGGGQAGQYLASRMDYQTRLRDAIRDVTDDRSTIVASSGKIWKFLSSTLPRKFEDANRQAEFQAWKRKGLEAGLNKYDAEVKAAYESRDLIDFAVKGKAIRDINRFMLFLNPGIQGVYREYRGLKEKPLPFVVRWGMYALVPTVAEMILNRETAGEEGIEEWRQLPAWRRDMFFNIYLGKGSDYNWLTIPKPFTMGVASSIVNRLIDKTIFGNENAFEGAGGSVARSLLPVDDSALLGPFKTSIEVMTNYSLFYEAPIVPGYEAERSPEVMPDRGSAMGRMGSAALSATLGQAFDKFARVDPRYVDYFVRGHAADFGLMAQYAGELINYEFVNEDPKAASDVRWRLAKLAMGNMVRDFKPDQARDVKRVVGDAMEYFGDRSEWYMPIRESLEEFRNTTDPNEKRALALDAIFAAKRIRGFIPEWKKAMIEGADKIDRLTSLDSAFKALDKQEQSMVKSTLYGEMRSLINERMNAQVSGNAFDLSDADWELRTYDLRMSLSDAIFEARQARQEKKLDRIVEPLIPPRQGR